MSRMKLFALEEEVVVDENTLDTALTEIDAEVTENTNETVDNISTVTSGEEAVDELTEVKDVMDQSVEAGTGLDPVAAEMARISIRNILSKIGAESYTGNLMVASESFGSTSSRLANTRYASENVGEFIGKIVSKIKSSVESLKSKIVTFLQVITKNIPVQKKLISELKNKVSSTEFSQENTTVKVSGFHYSSVKEYEDLIRVQTETIGQIVNIGQNFEKNIVPAMKEKIQNNSKYNKDKEGTTENNSSVVLYLPTKDRVIYKGFKFKLTADDSNISKIKYIKDLDEVKTQLPKVENVEVSYDKNKLIKLLSVADNDLLNMDLITDMKSLNEVMENLVETFEAFEKTHSKTSAIDPETGTTFKLISQDTNSIYNTSYFIYNLNVAIIGNSFNLSTEIIKYVNLCVKENGKKVG